MEALVGTIAGWIEKLWNFFIPFTVVKEYQAGVLLRFGKYKKVLRAGFHWCWPFYIDEVVECDIATETIETKPQSLTTKDGQNIVVSARVKCYVEAPEIYTIKVKDVTNAIGDITQGKIKDVIMKLTWEECRESNLDTQITGKVRAEATKWGVYVERVTTADLQLTRSIRLIQ
jgi:regulator of protease activity HflC (stomatin/prohibitin superfamily)